MKNVFLFTGNEELMIKNKIDKLVNSLTTNQYNINTYDMQINNGGVRQSCIAIATLFICIS